MMVSSRTSYGNDRGLSAINRMLESLSMDLKDNDLSPYYLINALPKCGSSYLYNLLSYVLDVKKTFISNPSFRTNEQDLYLPSLLDAYTVSTLSRQHFRATDQNIEYLKRFSITPVMLVRNIFDIVVSWRDNQVNGIILQNEPMYSYSVLGYYDKSFLEKSKEQQYSYIIHTTLPWIFNYLASWFSAEKNGISVMWCQYERLVAEPKDVLLKILEYFNYQKDESMIDVAIDTVSSDKKGNNFNKGVVGRGVSELSPEHVADIRYLASLYEYNFSMVGL